MKTNNERLQMCSGREDMHQAAAERHAVCRKGTFY